MIRENQHVLNILNVCTDALLLFVSYLLATYIRFFLMYDAHPSLKTAWNPQYYTAAILFAVCEIAFFYLSHLYEMDRRKSVMFEIERIVSWGALSILMLMAFLYFTRIVDFSRIAIGIYYGLSSVFLVTKRVMLRLLLQHFRKLGYNQKHVVLVGDGAHAKQYLEAVKSHPELGYHVDGYVSRIDKPELGRRLGTYEELEQILDRPGIDEVIITLEMHEAQFMQKVISACDKSGIRICIIPYFNDYIPPRPSIDIVGESRIINIRSIPLDHVMNAAIKRGFDILSSIFLIIITSPVMLAVAIGVKLSSPGPILFRQERMGKNKKPFIMLKFRSMRVNDRETVGWSQQKDSRRTKFGSFIRKFSLDEFPQFFNVLKGEMSLIGPRPELPHYVDRFKDEIPLYLIRHQVRPGITGWAQVNGFRGDTSIAERIRYDIWYIENWSIWLDLKIVLKTIWGGMINDEKIE